MTNPNDTISKQEVQNAVRNIQVALERTAPQAQLLAAFMGQFMVYLIDLAVKHREFVSEQSRDVVEHIPVSEDEETVEFWPSLR